MAKRGLVKKMNKHYHLILKWFFSCWTLFLGPGFNLLNNVKSINNQKMMDKGKNWVVLYIYISFFVRFCEILNGFKHIIESQEENY